jgi:hypothetical protein
MARSFNGTSDDIFTSKLASSTNANITVSAWVNPSSATSQRPVFCNGGVNTNNGFGVYSCRSADASSHFSVFPFGSAVVDSGVSISTSVWSHIAVTTDGSNNWSFYINGIFQSTVNRVSVAPTDTQCGIGGNGFSEFYAGLSADVAMWSVALSALEIKALANGARAYTIRRSALLSYWPLGGLQSPEPDLSGKANNGILTGTNPAFGPPLMQFTPTQALAPSAPPAAAIIAVNMITSHIEPRIKAIGY